jgi:hypothetical protein
MRIGSADQRNTLNECFQCSFTKPGSLVRFAHEQCQLGRDVNCTTSHRIPGRIGPFYGGVFAHDCTLSQRVAQGGHFVPDELVRRRFAAGLQNFKNLYCQEVDDWFLYDNSGDQWKKIDQGGKP